MNTKTINHLIKIGFELAGKWIKSTEKVNRIEFEIQKKYLEQSDLLYAFESNDNIYYIGKTDITLKERMNNYKAGKIDGTGGKTNKVVHEKILKLLDVEGFVNIYVLLNKLEYNYYGHKISLASGIEMSLISHFDSDILWNERGKKKNNVKIKQEIKISDKENKNISTENSNLFEMKLGKEYYYKGIISLPVSCKDLLPKVSGTQVDIEIVGVKIIPGTYTESGETRKINGKVELINWYNNLVLGDKIKIEIVSSLYYKITKI
ncbi:MAG: hypothetical protein WCH34_14965 [Bacteroidota bacterium]